MGGQVRAVAVPIHHRSGRVAYSAHVVDGLQTLSVCPHFDGHRSLKAAFVCGDRMKRAYDAASTYAPKLGTLKARHKGMAPSPKSPRRTA